MLGYFETNVTVDGIDLGPVDRLLVTRPILIRGTEIGLFQTYYIKDFETPLSVSYSLYGNVDYWWVLLFFNEMVSFYDWPMSYQQIIDYCNEKYEDPNAIAYHINTETKTRVDPFTEDGIASGTILLSNTYAPITNVEAEVRATEEKRFIKVPTKQALNQLLDELVKSYSV